MSVRCHFVQSSTWHCQILIHVHYRPTRNLLLGETGLVPAALLPKLVLVADDNLGEDDVIERLCRGHDEGLDGGHHELVVHAAQRQHQQFSVCFQLCNQSFRVMRSEKRA
jgi:hypothetical protein